MRLIIAWPNGQSRIGFGQEILAFPPWSTNALTVMVPEHPHSPVNETGVRRRQVRLLRLGKQSGHCNIVFILRRTHHKILLINRSTVRLSN